jgi:surface carbohydrate biosynthesis protein
MSAPATFPDIVPSETQSRGLDAKLLLAGCLAERGHPVVVGSRIEVHNRIHTLSRGPYLAKDVRRSSRRMVRVMDKLGFAIAAWDEEAFVFSDHSTCHNRQVDPENLNRIKAYFALGRSTARSSKLRRDIGEHRFPGLSKEEAQARLDRLSKVMGRFSNLKVRQVHPNVFRVSNG